jgi:uncharacterized protein YndB with AHSA1/START domain/uncharacterized membrane protein
VTSPPAAEDAVTCETVVPAPPQEVFRWLVRPELLVRWIGIDAQLEPRPGGLFRFEIAEGEWCSGRYLEVVPGRRVVVTWGWDSGVIPVPPGSSMVSIDLVEHPEGTLVRLVHSDLAPEVRRLHAEGWSRFLPRLAAVVAGRDPGEDPARDGPPPTVQPWAQGETPMPVDVIATETIDRPCDEVAAYLRDPANDTSWIGGIRSVRLMTPGPVAIGSQVERVASFLGRRVEYVNEITELTADRLVMRSVRSPFPMRVTYGHRRAGGSATEVSVRVEGDASRFYALLAPLLGVAMRRSIARDLRNLKRVLEGRPQPPSR